MPVTDDGCCSGKAVDFYDMTRRELAQYLAAGLGLSSYRSIQLFKWVYGKRVEDLSVMTDIKAELRLSLAEDLLFRKPQLLTSAVGQDGTVKFLLQFAGDARIETVIIKQPGRTTLCVSSQAGCAMACKFCRTAQLGFIRDLSCSEIIQQVLFASDYLLPQGDKIQNIVFMGMGEPLNNWQQVSRAIEVLTDQHGLGFAARRITVSTSGIVPGIGKLNNLPVKINLAISLNATTDQVRSELMPVNKAYSIAKLLGTLRSLKLRSNRRVTIEYVLLKGINDGYDDIKRLASLLRGLPVKVNLVPFNGASGESSPFSSPDHEQILDWAQRLNRSGIDTTIRWSKGADINAACGQLAGASR